jgi:hypothetical protein
MEKYLHDVMGRGNTQPPREQMAIPASQAWNNLGSSRVHGRSDRDQVYARAGQNTTSSRAS